MAFSSEYDPHVTRIESAISSLKEISNKLDNIIEMVKNIKSEGNKKTTKLVGVLRPILDTLKKNVTTLNLINQDNNLWRKALIIETSNYLTQNDQVVVTKHPTLSIPLSNAKWPPESSEVENINCNDD
jgi:Zn-dependent oligopeptidase